jgi:glutaredoxin-like protein NrdH
MVVVKVEGEKKRHRVFIYTLSTCGWCKRTKEFLKEQGVEYEYMDVDTCTSEERRDAIEDLKERKVPLGFPLAIIDDEKIISGFKPDSYKEVLGL